MNHSAPSLHPPVLTTQAHKDLVRHKLSSVAAERGRLRMQAARLAAGPDTVTIPLSTVSLSSNFDASIDISYRGADDNFSVQLMVDSGNSTLIVPSFADLAGLPDFSKNYTVLRYGVQEPWGCPACIVRGPIRILLANGVYEIANCEFFACMGPNDNGDLTANFGTGRIEPWSTASDSLGLRSPLSYDGTYPYAEFAYAPAGQILAGGSSPNVATGSVLTLHKAMPPGYQMFDILRETPWMSLLPQSLSIGGVKTSWPGTLSGVIAMVDTGGGTLFLSDPNNCLLAVDWPKPVRLPDPSFMLGSYSCQAISENLSMMLGDGKSCFSYDIVLDKLPQPAQGLSLTMCKHCYYMFGWNGMNIGGLSALFNYILIDYAAAKVGFKAKSLELV